MNSCTGPICSFKRQVTFCCFSSLIFGAYKFPFTHPSSYFPFSRAAKRTSEDVGVAERSSACSLNAHSERKTCSQRETKKLRVDPPSPSFQLRSALRNYDGRDGGHPTSPRLRWTGG